MAPLVSLLQLLLWNAPPPPFSMARRSLTREWQSSPQAQQTPRSARNSAARAADAEVRSACEASQRPPQNRSGRPPPLATPRAEAADSRAAEAGSWQGVGLPQARQSLLPRESKSWR